MSNPPQSFIARLIRKEQLTQDTYSLYFGRPQACEFMPGQYIKMILNIDNPDERGTSRFFTIAASPTERDHLMIVTRILQRSFKKTLGIWSIGAEIQRRGPHGAFVFNERDIKKRVKISC